MITPFGDAALLVDVEDDRAAHRLAARIAAAPLPPSGVGEVVIGLRTVLVSIDPMVADPTGIEAWLAGLGSSGPSDPAPPASSVPEPRSVEIPVNFDGPDLGDVAAAAGVGVDEVVSLLTAADLRVAFLGFAPGFPYLVGLPPALAAIPRRPSPRTQVPPGSVALAAGFAAVYPQRTPGGWHLLGHTDVPLFDPDHPPFALLRAGDTVRFTPADDRGGSPDGAPAGPTSGALGGPGDQPPGSARQPRSLLLAASQRYVEVLEPGTLTLLQDAGRHGLAAIGVPTAGAADPDGLRLANRLVGNPESAAACELTARGPTVRLSSDGYLAVVGDADLLLDDRPVAANTVLPVGAGQVLAIGILRHGLRSYLAVAGGLDGPVILGSRSSDVLSGLGVGPLQAGDRIDVGEPGRPRGHLAPYEAAPTTRLRAVPGPHLAAGPELTKLARVCWTVDGRSNRIGLRLTATGGDPGATTDGDQSAAVTRSTAAAGGSHPVAIEPPSAGIPSCGMVTGALQVPPDGQPIVLLPDHATVGGYPVIATVITADRGALGRLRPGDAVRFELVGVQEARAMRREHERVLDGRISGWFPTDSGT